METIVAVAIRFRGVIYSLPAPARHHSVIAAMHYSAELGLTIEKTGQDPFREQGFLTSKGRFVDRKEACQIAREAGQILIKTNPQDTLFSEDVW